MGLLMSALGGAAEVGINQIEEQRKADLQGERDAALEERSKRQSAYESELQTKRAEAQDKLKEERRVAEQARMEQEGQAAAEGGKEIRSKREIDTATKRAPSVNAETMGMLKASLSDAEIEKYYGVKAPTAVSEYDDQITSARQSGNLDTVDALRKGRKDALDEQKEARAERKLVQDKEIADARDETMQKRVEKLGAGGGRGDGLGAEKLEVTKAREKRLDLQKRIDVVIKQVETRMVKKEDGITKIRELEAQQSAYDKIIDGPESTEKVPKSTANGGKSTPVAALPKGAVQIGTSGGKPVYQTPDGKKFKAD